jgi:hypothetical protein
LPTATGGWLGTASLQGSGDVGHLPRLGKISHEVNFPLVRRDRFGLIALLAVIVATMAAILAVLIAMPELTAALAIALPVLVVAILGVMAFAANLRWSLWHGRRPVYFAVADYGFFACLAAFVFYGTANVFVRWDSLVWLVGGVLILALIRVVLLEFEAWLVGLAFSGLLVVVLGPYVRFTLVHPEWFFDFTAALLLLAGVVLLTAGSTGLLLESRRGRARMAPSAGFTLALRALIPALVLCMAVSALVTYLSIQRVAATDEAGTTLVRFEGGNLYSDDDPPAISSARILVRNEDLVAHSFSARPVTTTCFEDEFRRRTCETAYGAEIVDIAIGPGSERILTLNVQQGAYELRCRVPGHTEYPGSWYVE